MYVIYGSSWSSLTSKNLLVFILYTFSCTASLSCVQFTKQTMKNSQFDRCLIIKFQMGFN